MSGARFRPPAAARETIGGREPREESCSHGRSDHHLTCHRMLLVTRCASNEEDVLYVDEGNVITSAGSAAGIDACLHLVRRDFGSKIANSVARRLVMPPHREGGQAQYVAAPVQERTGRTVSEVMDWARKRLDKPLAVGLLAARAAMSERTFLRRFQASVGLSPADWLQRERMHRARELLESADGKLSDIAEQCGYRFLETFRAPHSSVPSARRRPPPARAFRIRT
jgi:transcriptional regulator GlxA family with amidase domain